MTGTTAATAAPASPGGLAGATPEPASSGAATPEQTRARYPDEQGYIERDGVRIFWERYGEGERTALLLPTWSIVHSQIGRASCRERV